jgi:hypothetical protein
MKTLLAILIALIPFRAYAFDDAEYMAGIMLASQVLCDNTTYAEFVEDSSAAVKKIDPEQLTAVLFFVNQTAKKAGVEDLYVYRDVAIATQSCLFDRYLREISQSNKR